MNGLAPLPSLPQVSVARDSSSTLAMGAEASGKLASAAAPEAAKPSPEILKAAREFEGIFLRTLLGSLEKTTKLGSSSSISAGQSTYGSMVVSALADSISNGGGIGLSEVVARALTARVSSEGSETK